MAGNVDASATNLIEMYGFHRLNLQDASSSVEFEVNYDDLRNIMIESLEEVPQEYRDTVSDAVNDLINQVFTNVTFDGQPLEEIIERPADVSFAATQTTKTGNYAEGAAVTGLFFGFVLYTKFILKKKDEISDDFEQLA